VGQLAFRNQRLKILISAGELQANNHNLELPGRAAYVRTVPSYDYSPYLSFCKLVDVTGTVHNLLCCCFLVHILMFVVFVFFMFFVIFE